jgi:hypothetical protein
MDNNDSAWATALLLMALLAATIGLGVGGCCTEASMRREAVVRGHAEYITSERGHAVWQWKDSK